MAELKFKRWLFTLDVIEKLVEYAWKTIKIVVHSMHSAVQNMTSLWENQNGFDAKQNWKQSAHTRVALSTLDNVM